MNLADEIIYGRQKNVEQLIKSGADVNDIDDYGFTPLIETAIANQTPIAALLIAAGAKVNQTDVVGSTALHWATENYNIPLCKLLLEHGANPNAYTRYGQPILVKPLLRRQHDLKELLYRHGADLNFAQDYINTKLIAHRYELKGRADIVDTEGKFIEIPLEGFILEFTINIILSSLSQFKNNFAARNLRSYLNQIQKIVDAFLVASELLKYQQYMVNLDQHKRRLESLLNRELLLLPVGSQGHAITFIKCGNLWAKCDRGANSLHEPSVIIYKVNNQRNFNSNFFHALLYQKHDRDFVNTGVSEFLHAEPIDSLPLSSQITGNCSWANVEAAIPTILYMLGLNQKKKMNHEQLAGYKDFAIAAYKQWLDWDKERALHQCIENFYPASKARKASIAVVLAAVLFQTTRFSQTEDLPKVNKILDVLADKEYDYILKSYLKVYGGTPEGNNLVQLLDLAGR